MPEVHVDTATPSPSIARTMLSKVPEVTIFFWIIKILATTVGETFADYINETLGFGLTKTTWVMTALLAIALFFQFRARRYVPALYWIVVVFISVVGTLITDNLTDGHNVPLKLTTSVFAVLLGIVFILWYRQEGTLSIHSIDTTKREAWYWLAILVTFSLGTAAGDLISESFNLGYWKSIVLFAGLIGIVAIATFVFKINRVLAFWLAYILTRPLGASIGDFMSQKHAHDTAWGLGLGTTGTSVIFLAAILGVVIFLTITKMDQPPPAVVDDTSNA